MNTEYCPTDYMCADVFTKPLTNKVKWDHAIELIGHVDPQRLWSLAGVAPRPMGVPEKKGTEDKTAGGRRQAAPATDPIPAKPQRTMIEFCCGPDPSLVRPLNIA